MSTPKAVWVYDIETLSNCFTVVFVKADSDETKKFVIHESRNDIEELLDFLESEIALIGYNNISFDYPVIHTLLIMPGVMFYSGGEIARMLYKKAQEVIEDKFSSIPPYAIRIPQCDLFRIYHYNNKARATSLKWLQIALNWKNVKDMPYSHDTYVTEDMIEEILEYNLNDVLSTKAFYLHSETRKAIDMRKSLSKKFNIRMLNMNDPQIGQEIILNGLAIKMNQHISLLRKMGTYRQSIPLKECILPGISFNTKKFQQLHKKLLNTVVYDTKGDIKNSVYYDGMVYDFGLGGLHACRESKIYETDDKYLIMTSDVSSYYPNLSIHNKFAPAHFGDMFCEVYEKIYAERKQYPKGTPENKGLKLSLNGSFGKSNDKYSPLRDPKMTMQITVNGQLLLAMLCEEITESSIGTVIMVNTDGIEVKIKREDKEKYLEACKRWEDMTGLELEHDIYRKIGIRDVNNYIAIKEDGDIYYKGAYEVERDFHKDPSMKIIRIAVERFFTDNIPIEKTIREHKNIFDFCLAVRSKSGSQFELRGVENDEVVIKPLQKTNRYIVTRSGGALVKKYTEGKSEGKYERVHVGYAVSLLNEITEEHLNMDISKFNLNYQFYIRETRKLITEMTHQQTDLFS